MSTFKARKKAAQRGGISHARLLSTSALTAAGLVALMPTAALAVDDFADWDNINIVAGDADVTDTGLGMTNIDQHSMQAVGEAQELHIGSMGHVNIDQTSSGALFVARVIGNHSDPTQILGMLTADGKVMILDRNGVLFGANSRVDVAGIAVSTGAVSNDDAMDGDSKTTFSDFGDGEIVLNGTINIAEAGLAAFVSPAVVNNGIINAKLGTVAMAAGEEVTVDLYGDGLVEITLDGELSDALLENKGTINAEGGNVIMTAQAAKDAVDNIINVGGVVNASSATQSGGKIILSGGSKGKVEVSGNLSANGEGGGEVSVTGQNIHVTETAEISADAGQNGDGGTIKLIADNAAIINGRLNARGGAQSGNGGFIDTSAYGYLGITNATVDTSATNGLFGTWLIDPLDFQLILGSGDTSNDGDSAPDQNLKWVVGGANTYASTTSHIYESELEAQNTSVILRAQRNFSVANGSGYGGTLGDGIIQMKANRDLTIETENTGANPGSINLTGSSFGSSLVFKTTGTGNININGSTNGGGVSNITLSKLQTENGNITIDTNNGDIDANGAISVSGTGYVKMTADHSAVDDGDIRINAAVGTQAGKVELTAEHDVFITSTGSITTKNGDVFLKGLAPTGESNVLIEGNVTTNGGDISVTAGDDVRVRAVLNTAGTSGANPAGNVSLRALGNNAADNAEITISNLGRIVTTDNLAFGAAEGSVWLEAEDLLIDTASGNKIDTTDDGVNDGTVTITRSTDGSIVMGDSILGDLKIDNGELSAITTQNLTIGDPDQANSKVTNILLSNVDTTANVSGLLSLNTWLNVGTGVPINSVGPNAFDNNNIGFWNINKTNAVTANANDHVIIYSASSLTTNGDVNFNADANKQGVGALVMGAGASLDSTGDDITFTGHEVLLIGGNINANGGDITLNNDSLFYSANANSLTTKDGGKITLNQHNNNFTTVFDGVTPFSQNASIGNAEAALNNLNGGQNTLNVYAGALGNTYNENITITQGNLKLNGVTGEDVVIAGNGLSEVIKVSASNFNLDPVTIDGNGAFYGLTASGAGANGLIVDGNTFRDTKTAGVLISNSLGGTSTVKNNIFEGTGSSDSTATRGVQIGTLTGGSTVNIENNTFGGGKLGTLVNAVWGHGVVTGGNVNITGANTASTTGQSVLFDQAISGGSTITIKGLTATSGADTVGVTATVAGSKINIFANNLTSNNGDGVNFSKAVSGSANIHIGANTINAGSDGIDFGGTLTDSTVRISNWNGTSFGTQTINADDSGVVFRNGLTNSTVEMAINTITALDGDGVRFEGAVDNSTVLIGAAGESTKSISWGAFGNIITASDSGIVFEEAIKNKSQVRIANGTITGQDGDGIRFEDEINKSGVTISAGNVIKGLDGSGVLFEGHVTNGSTVNIDNSSISAGPATFSAGGNTISGSENGIEFNGVDGKSTVNINKNTKIEGVQNGVLFGSGSPSVDNATVNINENALITGAVGVNFEDEIVNSSTVSVNSNTKIVGTANDAVLFDDNIKSSTVNVNNNVEILAFEDGIHFTGAVTGSKINANGNKIVSDDHGLYFGVISGKSTVEINDNRIYANQDSAVIGSGIFFDGTITDATINIGDGERDSNPSNFITVADNKAGSDDNLDGIHFNKDVGTGAKIKIDGNRIGYTGIPGNQGSAVADNVTDDGIEFRGQVTGTADIDIIDNRIMAEDDGIRFNGEVNGTANVLIGGSSNGNNITGLADGIQFGANVTGNALVEISQNNIAGNDSGIEFEGVSNTKSGSEQELYIYNNYVSGGNNGIRFNGAITGSSHDTRIDDNTILGLNEHGILFSKAIDSADVRIVNNESIEGEIDGIRFLGAIVDGARVDVSDNESIEGEDEEAIHFFEEIEESTVNIVGNDNLVGGDHGIEFAGNIDDSTILIDDNNHGIHADNHGILFGGDVFGGSDIDIHDNIISADEDGNNVGDGVHFAGDIYTATINIGDGSGPDYYDNPSNIIKGWDGIHFDGEVNNGARIVIDGNRLGYYKDSKGNHSNAELSDDGIQFIGDVDGDAEITITENRIQADDDGISFIGEIQDTAEVTIGGSSGQGNVIFADGDGIQFEDDIEDNALIKITHNDVEAEEDGIVFNGDTSNFRNGHDEEILIAYNDIVGGENGINFEGQASGSRHDIVIRDNDRIEGEDEDGIVHSGNIQDAELWILDNEEIYGDRDGIHIEGFFYDDARIVIDGNEDISADDGDGIEVTDNGFTGGSDVDITENYVHDTGDNGIEVNNVDEAEIKFNDITGAGNDGINVWNSDRAEINWNDIFAEGGNFFSNWGQNGAERDGIHVENSDYVDIIGNDITGDLGFGFIGAIHREGAGRDGIHVSGGRNADINWNEIEGDSSFFSAVNSVGRDGIHVVNNFDADIIGNDIERTGDDGIYAFNVDGADIRWNDISRTGDDGIDVRNSNWADIIGNDIFLTDGDGIQVRDSNFADINWNDIWFAGDDGIDFEDGSFSEINGNDINGADENGIEVEDSAFITISNNDVYFTEAGIFVDPSFFINVFGNDLQYNLFGVHFDEVWFGNIQNNNIENNLVGILLTDSHVIDIDDNTIANNLAGLWAWGGDNGYINVENNVFLDNVVHAGFNSGLIDLTNEGNEFFGGHTALYFNAWGNDPTKLSLVDDDAPGYQTLADTDSPTNFGGTLGRQYFEGQSDNFVYVGSNTFVDAAGTAIWMNGQDSTYFFPAEGGAFTPSIDGVTVSRLAFLQDMFFHYPDVNNRGIFWFGAVPDDAFSIDNFERHFNQFGPFGGGPVGLNITLTGLPSITGRAGGTAAFDLNAIAPAAGDEDGTQQTAAAASQQDLANIEPAAGGEEQAGCWGDAVSLAGTGKPANISFGGTFEESIAAAAGCGAQSF